MIEMLFQGRLGNNLSQYAYGRILAESLNYKLTFKAKKRRFEPYGTKEGLPGFPNATSLKGFYIEKPEKIIKERFNNPIKIKEVTKFRDCKLTLDGWFQFTDYYSNQFSNIRTWLDLPADTACYNISSNDICLNLRLGNDYNNHARCWVIDNNFFLKVLKNYTWNKLYICTDNKNSPLLEDFKKFKPIICGSGNPLTDFKFVKSFKHIAISTSSFSWWAAFLSQAERIFFPDTRKSQINNWKQGKHFVPESRYINIEAKGLNEAL